MISDYLIKVIVVLLPTQMGLHFWPSFSRVAGIKVDYLSPTLYFLDTLLILLVLLNLKSIITFFKKNLIFIGFFVSFTILNTIFSVSPANTIFWWFRIWLYLLVFLVLRLRRLSWKQIRTPLLYGTTAIVLIEVAQLFLQSSLGGPLYFLGERAFSGSTPAIGRFDFLGLEILRPISTFSHANSLAGYLLIIFYLFSKKSSKLWHKLVPFVGIILTFSKSAIVASAFIIFNLKMEIIILISIILTLAQPLIKNMAIIWQPFSDRFFYLFYLKNIILKNPLTGVGLGSFIPSLGDLLPGSFLTPSKLQPIHNLLFLAISELGFFGVSLALLTVIKYKLLKVLSNPLILGLFAIVLFTGTFDHYAWTLPQNRLIFLFALSIML